MAQRKRLHRGDTDTLAGRWEPAGKANGNRSAMLSCPDCGRLGYLGDHEIDPNGLVNPSVACPTKGCGFHEYVVLENWP